ncbi:MAG: hypothetical protein AABW57_02540 [Nanoarchaeota archaeon]
MKKSENIILYGVLILVIIALIFSISTFFSKGYSQSDYNKFVSAELSDKCKTPQGYTDQEWKEHMSHHPDRYKECLN